MLGRQFKGAKSKLQAASKILESEVEKSNKAAKDRSQETVKRLAKLEADKKAAAERQATLKAVSEGGRESTRTLYRSFLTQLEAMYLSAVAVGPEKLSNKLPDSEAELKKKTRGVVGKLAKEVAVMIASVFGLGQVVNGAVSAAGAVLQHWFVDTSEVEKEAGLARLIEQWDSAEARHKDMEDVALVLAQSWNRRVSGGESSGSSRRKSSGSSGSSKGTKRKSVSSGRKSSGSKSKGKQPAAPAAPGGKKKYEEGEEVKKARERAGTACGMAIVALMTESKQGPKHAMLEALSKEDAVVRASMLEKGLEAGEEQALEWFDQLKNENLASSTLESQRVARNMVDVSGLKENVRWLLERAKTAQKIAKEMSGGGE